MGRRIFRYVCSLLLLCVIPTRTETKIGAKNDFGKIASDDEWKINNGKIMAEDRAKRENYFESDEIKAEEISCSRYCVRRRIIGEDSGYEKIKRVNIIWNILDQARVEFNGETSNGWGASSVQDIFHNDESKCELYLELGCKTFALSNSTIYDEFSNSNQKKLVSKENAVGPSLVSFSVNEVTDQLRIVTFGKISHVVLEIPIARRQHDFKDGTRVTPTFSLSPTKNAEGLLIDAQNPPFGEWRLKLFGIKSSNYNFSITAITFSNVMDDSTMKHDSMIGLPLENEITFENVQSKLDVNSSDKLSRPQRLAYLKTNDENEAIRAIKSNGQLESSTQKEDFPKEMTSTTNDVKLTRNVEFERELVEIEERGKIKFQDSEESPRILEKSELEDLSRVTENNQSLRRKTIVDIISRTELVARPGTVHEVVFSVTNNQPQDIRYGFEAKSQPFTALSVITYTDWIRAGDMIYVVVRIQVPNIQDSEPYLVTLYVRGINDYEVVEKSVYIYIEGSIRTTTRDSEKPIVKYSFNDNCSGKLHQDLCGRSLWSVEITIEDPDSGLKRVTSVPTGVLPRSNFIAGSKHSEIFHYTSTCCNRIVDITATDVQGNSFMQKIDVRAWNNLTTGEIAAIVVGALFILLLIILIIIIIIYCIRKRKSHDLSYSQRYGSRPPASTERANF